MHPSERRDRFRLAFAKLSVLPVPVPVKTRLLLLILTVLLISVTDLTAQGTVYFTTRVVGLGIDAVAREFSTNLRIPAGRYLATLYWGTSASSLQPAYTLVNGVPTYLACEFNGATGYVTAGKIAILGAAEGAPVFLKVCAWDRRFGATFAEARPCYADGTSNIILVTLGGDDLIPPVQPAYLRGLQYFYVNPIEACYVPEPTPMALGLVGGALLLLRRRSK
jgi:hypothetical protein